MSITTSRSVERVYVLLREAAELLSTPASDHFEPSLRLSVVAMEFQALVLVKNHSDADDATVPTSVEACVSEAAAETLRWDLAELPPEAAQLILDLSDVKRELMSSV